MIYVDGRRGELAGVVVTCYQRYIRWIFTCSMQQRAAKSRRTVVGGRAELHEQRQVAQQQPLGGRGVAGRKLPDRAAPEAARAAEAAGRLGWGDRHVLGVDRRRAQRAAAGAVAVPAPLSRMPGQQS